MVLQFTCIECGETNNLDDFKNWLDVEEGRLKECPKCNKCYKLAMIPRDKIEEVRKIVDEDD